MISKDSALMLLKRPVGISFYQRGDEYFKSGILESVDDTTVVIKFFDGRLFTIGLSEVRSIREVSMNERRNL